MTEVEKEQKITQIVEDLVDLTTDCTCLGITNDECDKCFRQKIAKYVFERGERIRKRVLQKLYAIASEYQWRTAVESYSPVITMGALKDIIEEDFDVKIDVFGAEV